MIARLGFAIAVALLTGAAVRPSQPGGGLDPVLGAGAAPKRTGPARRIEILTYNVAGLPWPAASGRPAALARIGDELARMRARGDAPDVVLLQEAFTAEAREIGARAGYRYRVDGPVSDDPPTHAGAMTLPGGGKLVLGETVGPMLSSGLVILSDFRITAARRAPFPTGACAGYDCLANKGMVAATLAVPGVARPVEIIATHLNSANPSGRPERESRFAYAAQLAALDRFIGEKEGRLRTIRIIAGDFNVGHSPQRLSLLAGYIKHWKMKPATAMGRDKQAYLCVDDPQSCRGDLAIPANVPLIHANDWQFYPGEDAQLRPFGRAVRFGRDPKGRMLSDHIGFSVAYQFR